MKRTLGPLAFAILFTGCQTDILTGESELEDPEIFAPEAPEIPDEAANLAEEALRLVNATRATGCRCGNTQMPPAPPLTVDSRLVSAAQSHSEDQARMRRMQHRGSDGSNVADRVTRTNYEWRRVGENIAWNYPNVSSAVRGWFSSEGHCLNLMNTHFQHMGFGEKDRYWTQVFATE